MTTVADIASSDEATTSLTRGVEHLDQFRWMQTIALAAVVRTFLAHPITVAIARKRVHRDFVPLSQVLRETYREGVSAASASGGPAFGAGWRALYRGFGVCAVGNAMGECVYLGLVENVRHALPVESSVLRDAAGGASGDAMALVLCTPLSVVCNRQMTAGYGMAAHNRYDSVTGTVRGVVDAELKSSTQRPPLTMAARATAAGRGLYAGFLPSLYVVPASGVWWGSYGVIKQGLYGAASPYLRVSVPDDASTARQLSWWQQALYSSTDNVVLNGLAGVTASLVTVTASNPFTVIRTRMQIGSADSSRRSAARVVSDLVQKEGYSALLKGVKANAAVAVVDGLIFSSVYEVTKWISDTTKH